MFMLYWSIPLMVLALAVATIPVIIGMVSHEKERRAELEAAALAGVAVPSSESEGLAA